MKSIPEAIRDLFDIDTAAESSFLKDKANSFKRNGLLKVEEEARVQRNSVYLAQGQETVLFNALVLNAVFPDPKYVKKIFEDRKSRAEASDIISNMLIKRSNVSGIALASAETAALVSYLEGDSDLYSEKLPNPFETLPQLAFGQHTNLLNVLLAQASMLDPLDSVLAAYVAGDIDKACNLAESIKDQSAAKPFLDLIRKQHQEVKRFTKLLDDFF